MAVTDNLRLSAVALLDRDRPAVGQIAFLIAMYLAVSRPVRRPAQRPSRLLVESHPLAPVDTLQGVEGETAEALRP